VVHRRRTRRRNRKRSTRRYSHSHNSSSGGNNSTNSYKGLFIVVVISILILIAAVHVVNLFNEGNFKEGSFISDFTSSATASLARVNSAVSSSFLAAKPGTISSCESSVKKSVKEAQISSNFEFTSVILDSYEVNSLSEAQDDVKSYSSSTVLAQKICDSDNYDKLVVVIYEYRFDDFYYHGTKVNKETHVGVCDENGKMLNIQWLC
jgi:hypothetical protein